MRNVALGHRRKRRGQGALASFDRSQPLLVQRVVQALKLRDDLTQSRGVQVGLKLIPGFVDVDHAGDRLVVEFVADRVQVSPLGSVDLVHAVMGEGNAQ